MTTSDQTLLRLEGVTKVFLTDEVETHALSGIHLEINAGEYVAIAGPSGCGKSTLLSILGLLDSPSEGTYLLNNRSVADLAASERARVRNREIGFIFQSFNLIGDLTVFENVELPLTYRGMKAAERKQRVEAALERVGMAHRAKHLPSQLSGGPQQRVAVARAAAGEPLILLADEPTGNLDSRSGEAVMDLLVAIESAAEGDDDGPASVPDVTAFEAATTVSRGAGYTGGTSILTVRGDATTLHTTFVTADLIRTLDVPLLRGRSFSEQDV